MSLCNAWKQRGLVAAAIVLVGAQVCFAQDGLGVGKDSISRGSSKLASHEKTPVGVSISYQLLDWKQMHFHDAQQAEKHLKSVEQLGCVAKKSQHGGHIDVRYHCQEWRSITLANAEDAKQWYDWLQSAGFDVFRPEADPSFSKGTDAVQFKLADYKSVHGDGSPEQSQFVDTLKKIGCDVRELEHNGHSDIRYRAPTWCTIRVADASAANDWLEWLTSQGFDARLSDGP